MRKVIKLSIAAAAISLISACGNADQKSVELNTDLDKQSYALGASMGRYLNDNLTQNAEIGIKLDQEKLLGGIRDALAENVQLTEDEIKTVMIALEAEVNKRRDEKQKELTAAAKGVGETFLAENAKKEGVTVTESGLQYEVLTASEGAKPAATDKVTVHYHGTFLDGSVFDSSVERGEPATFGLNQVIAGWTEGLQYMTVGSKYKFYIPYDLAYGERGRSSIPGYSTLVFEVELLSIAN
ncbi:FKBP-type peptidyl-prolyl cis-trans isomerase [uncultured Psychrosphaera sp.]|jgi:FKBP-type peptidyl-prolyl cis-trans isomerase FkpA|uniref:FKBP-type peptidyl-prolyl cis-trans isomerase n=1 Tax=uncultured Psychrosphaera sp. TaxID=1403522 RepID=UPI002610248F|nr:FKBP-type peptidyl-prolyl cis-trans isomerase [uncultured Psychrosphaera sp.]